MDDVKRSELAALLKLMKQEQRNGSPVFPLDQEAFAKAYVRIRSRSKTKDGAAEVGG